MGSGTECACCQPPWAVEAGILIDANTPWCGSENDKDGKLFLQSGQFTGTLKASQSVESIATNPGGIAWDGTDTPWSGNSSSPPSPSNVRKLFVQSGQFTSTVKESEDVTSIDLPSGIAWDGTNSPWTPVNNQKLYLQSGRFTSTIKDSEDISGTSDDANDISWDGTDTPWCGITLNKLYLQSGQFTSTIKASEDVSAAVATLRGIGWDGTNTPWCGVNSMPLGKLYLQSGQFTSTIKASQNVDSINERPEAVKTNKLTVG
jgi:hypothetical protein